MIKAVDDAREWQLAQRIEHTLHALPSVEPIQTISPDLVIRHTDAAWREDVKAAGLGWVFWDQSSRVIDKGARIDRFVLSPAQPEALAIREALKQAIEKGWKNISIK